MGKEKRRVAALGGDLRRVAQAAKEGLVKVEGEARKEAQEERGRARGAVRDEERAEAEARRAREDARAVAKEAEMAFEREKRAVDEADQHASEAVRLAEAREKRVREGQGEIYALNLLLFKIVFFLLNLQSAHLEQISSCI